MYPSSTVAKGPAAKASPARALRLLVVAGGCYAATRAGQALDPWPLAWPAGVVLLSALLVVPAASWRSIAAVAFVAQLATWGRGTLPPLLLVAEAAGSCGAALIAARLTRALIGERVRFDSFRHVAVFLFCCALAAPLIAALADTAVAAYARPDAGWAFWRARFVPHVAAVLVIVPVLAGWNARSLALVRRASLLRHLEGALLASMLFGLAGLVFVHGAAPGLAPLLLYAVLPLLLYAAVRFDPLLASLALLLFAAVAAWGVLDGGGPAVAGLALFLVATALPLLLLAAAMQEWHAARRALRERDEALGMATRAAGIGAWELDPAARTVSCSARLLDLFGLDGEPRSVALDTLLRRVHPEDRGNLQHGMERAGVHANGCLAQFRVRQPDGEVRWLALRGAACGDGQSPRVCGVALEVTAGRQASAGDEAALLESEAQRRKAERALGEQRAQVAYLTRAVVLGELCGAIAHELNQPLAAIVVNAQAGRRCLARTPAAPSALGPILDDIADAGKHAAAVIRHLRALFLRGEAQLRPLDLNDVVRDALQLARCALDEHQVEASLSLGAGLPPVRGDCVQLQQVLLNLAINACQAMQATPPGSRQLAIATRLGPGGAVELTVADRGPGIPAAALAHIFDPFFTTTPQGLGFGLSVSRAIIDAHGGRIEAANDGGGALFRITLPSGEDEHER